MRIETDVYVTGEARVDLDGEIQIENILVNGEASTSEKLRELAYEVLLEQNEEWVFQNQPTDEDIESSIGDERYHAMVDEGRLRRVG